MLIDPTESRYLLGVPQMDETHREFTEIVNRLAEADKPGFVELFPILVAHTQAHFDSENELMERSGFPAIREHTDEHQRVLGELHRLAAKLENGSITLARAYVREQLPTWFDLHAATMDSALAEHLKRPDTSVIVPLRNLHQPKNGGSNRQGAEDVKKNMTIREHEGSPKR